MDAFVPHNYQDENYQNKSINKNNQSLTVSAEDLAYFDSIPTLDISKPVDPPELNPSDIVNYMFFIYGMPIPVNIFNKFVISSDKDFIPTNVSESIRGIFSTNLHYGENANNQTKYRMVCIRSVLPEIETICILYRQSETNKYLYVIGSKHRGEYSFINKIEPEVSVGGDYPIRMNITSEDIDIMNINKSTIKGYESGATNVKIALSICSYLNPKGYYDIRITDAATIPCSGKKINMSLFLFLTRPVFRISWYNSFGFGSKYDDANMKTLQIKLQSLKMIKIKTYLETLLTNIKKGNIYFVSKDAIEKYKRDESLENEIQALIDLIEAEEAETLSDFFRKSENCKYFGLLFGFGLTYEADSDAHKIPNVYVDNSGLKPVVHIFPHFNDFLYVFENIGGERTIKGKGLTETSANLNETNLMNRGGKRKTRRRAKRNSKARTKK
jgi:hypothetical protein